MLDAYEQFGGELVAIGQTFDTLAADFLKLGDALHGGGGGPVTLPTRSAEPCR